MSKRFPTARSPTALLDRAAVRRVRPVPAPQLADHEHIDHTVYTGRAIPAARDNGIFAHAPRAVEERGRALVRRLKAYGDLRVNFTSGDTDDTILQQGGLERGVQFVQKPFTPPALLERVREVLDSAGAPLPPTAAPAL